MRRQLNPKEMDKIREKIEALELKKVSCGTVSTRNIRVKDGLVIANVKIRDGAGEPISFTEDVQYPLDVLRAIMSV